MQIHVSRVMNVLTLHFPFCVLSPFIYDVYILYIASSCGTEQHRELWREKMLSAFLKRVKEVQKKKQSFVWGKILKSAFTLFSKCILLIFFMNMFQFLFVLIS